MRTSQNHRYKGLIAALLVFVVVMVAYVVCFADTEDSEHKRLTFAPKSVALSELVRETEALTLTKIEEGFWECSVHGTVDLQGNRVVLPRGVALVFDGGQFVNGILVGDSTTISYNKLPIFDHIEISGSWSVTEICTDMFQPIDDSTLRYLSELSSENQFNRITVNHDCTEHIKPWSSYFTIKSNTEVVLNADISMLPSDYVGGYCINVVGCDVVILGNGHTLFGDINRQNSNRGQWLHGLFIGQSSNNIRVCNLNAKYFCGDGFYSRGTDVIFDSITSEYNGRQGLSITFGENVIIKNSTFRHTGKIGICSCGGPGAGIDIEPNEGDIVRNIQIDSCVITDNYHYMQGYANDLEIYNAFNSSTKVTNSIIGGIYLGNSSDVLIVNSRINGEIFGIDRNVSHISIVNSGKPQLSKLLDGFKVTIR